MDLGAMIIFILMIIILSQSIQVMLVGMGRLKNKRNYSSKRLLVLKYLGILVTIMVFTSIMLWLIVYFDTY